MTDLIKEMTEREEIEGYIKHLEGYIKRHNQELMKFERLKWLLAVVAGAAPLLFRIA